MRRRVVAVIGNASPSEEGRAVARELGKLLVEAGYRIVSGGLGGVMEAASAGAHDASNYREGDVVGIIPQGQSHHANPHVDIVVPSGMGYGRNMLVVQMADAVVAVGGGAGTLTEMAMAWQLDKPLVGLEVDGWSAKLAGQAIDGRERAPIERAQDASAAVEAVGRLLA